jgi:hypothetical protein
MPVYTNPDIDQEVSPKFIYYVDNKCAIFTCNGSPEGVILANTGSIAISDNGSIYKKTTDGLTTGWIELASGTVSSPLSISGTNPTLNFIDTDVGDDDGVISVQSDLMTIGIVGGTPININALGQILGIERNINIDVSTVGNVLGGLDTLHNFSLLANRLANNNDYIKCKYGGTFAINDNDKRIRLSIDAQTSFDSGLKDIDFSQWWAEVIYTRLSATTVRANGYIAMGQIIVLSNGAIDVANSTYDYRAINVPSITVANLNSNAVNLTVQAEGTASNDIVQNDSKQWLCQF